MDDLIDHNKCAWKKYLVEAIFSHHDAEKILALPLLNVMENDKVIWKFSPTGTYIVRTAYHNTIENILDNSHLRSEGDWMLIWKLRQLQK